MTEVGMVAMSIRNMALALYKYRLVAIFFKDIALCHGLRQIKIAAHLNNFLSLKSACVTPM
jgi:hypothetical protein